MSEIQKYIESGLTYSGDRILLQDGDTLYLESYVKQLQRENEGLRALAEERRQFIVNSVEYGYCTLPDESVTDSANDTYKRCNLEDAYAVAEIQAKAVEDAAREVIEQNDHVTERLILGSNKQPDNYRAEGWYQAQRAFEVYAASLRKGSSESDGGVE